ncbi:histidine kinase [Paenibacillus sp. FSL R7-0273]|uniref:sensor histidine kinase n=1 Tax=Paenibacillus sp. FSL R7-0273 TaxID=1536772 RepID=UPI0004F8FC9F|nr:ATP-binding protein [Paenibacillus sp. FSL R7-0273]AIQ45007.1 histidine kinase [Paenibacillus sp. FSL R7-0273]OMF88682.1 ATP-binding protein [Paenibacillus sp. FSL R7-0273]
MGQFILKNRAVQIAMAAFGTAIAGEFKINPFDGDVFRIAMGSSAFLLFLLLMRRLPYITTGIATGIVVLLFRTGMDAIGSSGASATESLTSHFSAMIYYIVFAVLMSLIKSRIDTFHPLVLGGVAAVIDLLSNELELLTRLIVLDSASFRLNEWTFLMAIAVVRTYFTTGVYSSISVSQLRIKQREQNRRMEQMMSFSSGLYGEVFYLKKSIGTLERVTLSSYDLYRSLKAEETLQPYSRQVLDITQQIHEVKKDSQRILAGLVKLADREVTGDLPLSVIMKFTMKSNAKYAEMLGKHIHFTLNMTSDYTTASYTPLLTLLGNLTANAVEVIKGNGSITLDVHEDGENTVFAVADSGGGIKERDRELLFEPGFTTKFDQEGVAATGIGLSHVQDIVHLFAGQISVEPVSESGGARFQITIPTSGLRKEE